MNFFLTTRKIDVTRLDGTPVVLPKGSRLVSPGAINADGSMIAYSTKHETFVRLRFDASVVAEED